MRRADLVLWMLIYPWSTLTAGLLAGLGSYVLAMPRRIESSRGDLAVEAWRLVAILAAIPAFFLGAELMLWGRDLAFQAPLAFTGLPWAAGLWLLCLAPIPLLAVWTRFEPLAGRPLIMSAMLAALGLFGMWVGPWSGARAWATTVDAAAEDPAALARLVELKAHRYVSAAMADAALDMLLPSPVAVLDLIDAQAERFDRDLGGYCAARLESALADGRLSEADRAIPAIWRLTGDPARTLGAYALTVPELRDGGRASSSEGREGLDPQRIGLRALEAARGPLRQTLFEALYPLLDGMPLEPEMVEAMASALDEQESIGSIAMAVLLRDGSRAALRPALPRFVDAQGARVDYDGPAWAVLRRDCMSRTAGLSELREDEDPSVAAGATEVFKYVRQYCGKRWRQS